MFCKRKRILITSVIIVIMLSFTACGKTEEETKDTSVSAVEAENLPMPEKPEREELSKNEESQNEESQNEESKKENASSFHYIARDDYDLYGDIYEVGEMEFTVTEVYHEKLEDGGEVMDAVAEGAEDTVVKIKVVYDKDTKLIKQVVRDGGASHEEREGTAADLQKGFTAEMVGSYEGDVFHATEILIVEVIL